MLSSQRTKLMEHFMCSICLDTVKSPRLCPTCSKMFCCACLEQCFAIAKLCPLCRHQVRDISKFIKCNWVEQLTEDIDGLGSFNNCQKHSELLSLYCFDCKTVICSNCALFETDHTNHQISPLKDVCDYFRRETLDLKKRVEGLCDQLSQKQNILHKSFCKYTKEKDRYLQSFPLSYVEGISLLYNEGKEVYTLKNNTLKTKLDKIAGALKDMKDVISHLRSCKLASLCCVRCHELLQSSQLKHLLQEEEDDEESMDNMENTTCHLKMPRCMAFCPEYTKSVLKLYDFSHNSSKNQVVHSEVLSICNLKFKLELHTAGLISDARSHKKTLSVFVMLVNPDSVISVHDLCVRVQIVNQYGNQHADRESKFCIKVGPGYPKSVPVPELAPNLDTLVQHGYIRPEVDCLVVRFAIRPMSYQTLSQIQQDYIQELSEERRPSPSTPVSSYMSSEQAHTNVVSKVTQAFTNLFI